MALRHLCHLRRNLLRVSTSASGTYSARNCSSVSKRDETFYEHSVVANPSQNYILCWHPKQPIKYEHTKPLTVDQELDEGVLNEVDLRLLHKDRSQEEIIEELKALTYTTKHIWYPKSEKRTLPEPKPREYM